MSGCPPPCFWENSQERGGHLEWYTLIDERENIFKNFNTDFNALKWISMYCCYSFRSIFDYIYWTFTSLYARKDKISSTDICPVGRSDKVVQSAPFHLGGTSHRSLFDKRPRNSIDVRNDTLLPGALTCNSLYHMLHPWDTLKRIRTRVSLSKHVDYFYRFSNIGQKGCIF